MSLVLLFVVGILLFTIYPARAASPSWSGTNKTLSSINPISDPSTIADEVPRCTKDTVPTRNTMFLTALTYTGCFTQTDYGYTDGAYLRRPGSKLAGKLTDYQGFNSFIPVPNSNRLLAIQNVSGGYGYKISVYSNPLPFMETRRVFDGQIKHQIKKPYDGTVKDKSGAILAIEPRSMSFSSDGRWMTGVAVGAATVRIDLQTLEVVPYAPKVEYGLGYDPMLRTAISPSGRYALSYATTANGHMRLYDLSTCKAVPDRITAPVVCESNDLVGFMSSQKNYGTYVLSKGIVFTSEYSLKLYPYYRKSDSNLLFGESELRAQDYIKPDIDYLALGDSFSSGEGARDYELYTDQKDNRCHVSKASYPYLVARDVGASNFHSVTCSGALLDDVNQLNDKKYSDEEPQSHGKENVEMYNNEIFTKFLPGYRGQLRFFDYYTVENTSVTIGGNDIGFGDIVASCVTSIKEDTCYKSYEDRLEKLNDIKSQFQNLADTYARLRQKSKRVYVLAYPKITSQKANCAVNVKLDEQELEFADGMVEFLNKTIRQAAKKAGVVYVDTQEVLVSTALCSGAAKDKISVNGLTAGSDIFIPGVGPIGNESYHPNSIGHQLLANKLSEATSLLTTPMPEPDGATIAPSTDKNAMLDKAAKTGRIIRSIKHADNLLIKDRLNLNETFELQLDPSQYNLDNTKTYNVILFSDPTTLGSFTITDNQLSDNTFSVPQGIKPGYHTLHIQGETVENEPIDIYRGVWVGSTAADFDGDTVPDTSDSCVLIANSGIDIDKDGIDDACDEDIVVPPPPMVIGIPEVNMPDESLLIENPKADGTKPNDQPSGSNPGLPVTPPAEEPTTTVQVTNTTPAPVRVVRNRLVTTPPQSTPDAPPATAEVSGVSTFANTPGVAEDKSITELATPKTSAEQFPFWLLALPSIPAFFALVLFLKKKQVF